MLLTITVRSATQVLVTLPSVRIPNMNRTIYFGIFMAHPSWLASKFGHIMTYHDIFKKTMGSTCLFCFHNPGSNPPRWHLFDQDMRNGADGIARSPILTDQLYKLNNCSLCPLKTHQWIGFFTGKWPNTSILTIVFTIKY